MLEFYFRFRFLRFCHHRHGILHLPAKFSPYRTICNTVMTSYSFLRCRIAIPLPVSLWLAHSGWSKSTWKSNFGDISSSMVKLFRFAFPQNKRPRCWNSTAGFDFYLWIVIGMSFGIDIASFTRIELSAAKLWCHSDF